MSVPSRLLPSIPRTKICCYSMFYCYFSINGTRPENRHFEHSTRFLIKYLKILQLVGWAKIFWFFKNVIKKARSLWTAKGWATGYILGYSGMANKMGKYYYYYFTLYKKINGLVSQLMRWLILLSYLSRQTWTLHFSSRSYTKSKDHFYSAFVRRNWHTCWSSY